MKKNKQKIHCCPECGQYQSHHPNCPNNDDSDGEIHEVDFNDDDDYINEELIDYGDDD